MHLHRDNSCGIRIIHRLNLEKHKSRLDGFNLAIGRNRHSIAVS